MELLTKVVQRWEYERNNYPGWLVAEDSKRSAVWGASRHWIGGLIAFSRDWGPADQVLLFREIIWRLEISMVPLLDDWLRVFERTIDALFAELAAGRTPSLSLGLFSRRGRDDVSDAWCEVSFALLRDAREMYDADAWKARKSKIDKVAPFHPKYSDRERYESALWALWNVDRHAAKAILKSWQPSAQSPLALMRKSGLLAELEELSEAKAGLRSALSEIRKGLRTNARNIGLLSLEGWCTYLLFSVEIALDFSSFPALQSEFWERWQELKAWDCSPWPQKRYFENALSGPQPTVPEPEEKRYGFDPGHTSITHNLSGALIDPYFPAFAFIRLYEQVGIPMHLPHVNLMGNALMHACLWIAPFAGFWSPALLIRAAKTDVLKSDHFLSRTKVAAMEPALAKRLFDWCLAILHRELSTRGGAGFMGPLQEALFEVVPGVLSRLTLKCDTEQLKTMFALALQLHYLPALRLHATSEAWFRRLFEAADSALLLEWLPLLIRAPLFDGPNDPTIGESRGWPDPMEDFPSDRLSDAKQASPNLCVKVVTATDWLLRRTASEDGEARRRALNRLNLLYHANLMTPTQQRSLGNLLWSSTATTGLPDLPSFSSFGFLHLPAPKTINVRARVRNYILSLPFQTFAILDAAGKVSGLQSGPAHRLIHEVSVGSRAPFQLLEMPNGTIDWTPEQSKQLYMKARAWWTHDKGAVGLRSFGSHPVLETLEHVGEFLAHAIIPALQRDDPVWEELIEWLSEMRALGVFPTVALPYILNKQPKQLLTVTKVVYDDILSDDLKAVAAAAEAIRHWTGLAAIQRAAAPPPEVLSALLDRVVFRRKPSIKACLVHMTYLLLERPLALPPERVRLLVSSLVPWHAATILPIPSHADEEFAELDRPALRLLLGRLAGALSYWVTQTSPKEIEPSSLGLWRTSCASDPLPEVRRAFLSCADYRRLEGSPKNRRAK